MKPWERFASAPKKPPPKHGIKVKKPGTTWWGQRWLEALERISAGYASRLARGRTYARAGRTHDLVILPGKVQAKVTGSRSSPYEVTIELAALPDAIWRKAIAAMAKKAQFAAELLAGQMPADIDQAFHAAGTSLFPARESDLVTACSCPDWANPCKHVAAAHYVLGAAFDRDPFLLFELRGRSKQQVLDALRIARSGRTREKRTRVSAPVPSKVRLDELAPADYDKPRTDLPALHFSFEEPAAPAAILRQLGTPPAWEGDESPAEFLAPLVRSAAQKARRLALDEPAPENSCPVAARSPVSDAGDRKLSAAPKPTRKKRR